jgi:hypothetical protein
MYRTTLLFSRLTMLCLIILGLHGCAAEVRTETEVDQHKLEGATEADRLMCGAWDRTDDCLGNLLIHTWNWDFDRWDSRHECTGRFVSSSVFVTSYQCVPSLTSPDAQVEICRTDLWGEPQCHEVTMATLVSGRHAESSQLGVLRVSPPLSDDPTWCNVNTYYPWLWWWGTRDFVGDTPQAPDSLEIQRNDGALYQYNSTSTLYASDDACLAELYRDDFRRGSPWSSVQDFAAVVDSVIGDSVYFTRVDGPGLWPEVQAIIDEADLDHHLYLPYVSR